MEGHTDLSRHIEATALAHSATSGKTTERLGVKNLMCEALSRDVLSHVAVSSVVSVV